MCLNRTFTVGTRGSRSHCARPSIVVEALRRAHPDVSFETHTIHTEGDRSTAALSELGGRGVFVIEIERALLAGEIDIAVHSLKDLPGGRDAGPDHRRRLPSGRTRATCSSRARRDARTACPRARPSAPAARAEPPRSWPRARTCASRDIRGNVDTRLRKVEDGEYDATVLAAAGLSRLGWLDRATQIFESRRDAPRRRAGRARRADAHGRRGRGRAVAALDHPATRAAVTAERAFERRLGGGCHAAIAAYGVIPDGAAASICAASSATLPAPSSVPKSKATPADADALGVTLAERLIELGAGVMLEAAG